MKFTISRSELQRGLGRIQSVVEKRNTMPILANVLLEAKGEGDIYITQGGPTCLVTSIGRKTGNEIVSPANFMQDGDDVYVVGSIAGLEKHPHWALNLEATPRGWVQIKANKYPVKVQRLVAEERAAIWPRLTEYFRLWGHFQKYCDREFMVFRLSPEEK